MPYMGLVQLLLFVALLGRFFSGFSDFPPPTRTSISKCYSTYKFNKTLISFCTVICRKFHNIKKCQQGVDDPLMANRKWAIARIAARSSAVWIRAQAKSLSCIFLPTLALSWWLMVNPRPSWDRNSIITNTFLWSPQYRDLAKPLSLSTDEYVCKSVLTFLAYVDTQNYKTFVSI